MSEEEILAMIENAKKRPYNKPAKYSDTVYTKLIDFVNSLIGTEISLNEQGIKDIIKVADKFGIENTLQGIQEATKYLRVTGNESPHPNNVDQFLDKIPAVVSLIDKPQLERQIHYCMGIGKNKFGPWSCPKIKDLTLAGIEFYRSQNLSDDVISDWMEKIYIPNLKDASNWTSWKKTLPNKWFEE
jgi:hypothetical protein